MEKLQTECLGPMGECLRSRTLFELIKRIDPHPVTEHGIQWGSTLRHEGQIVAEVEVTNTQHQLTKGYGYDLVLSVVPEHFAHAKGAVVAAIAAITEFAASWGSELHIFSDTRPLLLQEQCEESPAA